MSGDWLKIELNTPDKPEVWAIATELNIDPDAVTGKLLRLWAWFDQHSEKGNAPSVSKMLINRLVSVSGFCDSVIKAGWMIEENNEISLPNFDRHNGKTGKTRSLTAKRVALHKAKTQKLQKSNGASVSSALPREEKRREDIKEKVKKKNIVTATPICKTFKPTQRDYDLLLEKGIDKEFADSEINYFIQYWTETGEKKKSWNATFRNRVKTQFDYAQKNNHQLQQIQKPVREPLGEFQL